MAGLCGTSPECGLSLTNVPHGAHTVRPSNHSSPHKGQEHNPATGPLVPRSPRGAPPDRRLSTQTGDLRERQEALMEISSSSVVGLVRETTAMPAPAQGKCFFLFSTGRADLPLPGRLRDKYSIQSSPIGIGGQSLGTGNRAGPAARFGGFATRLGHCLWAKNEGAVLARGILGDRIRGKSLAAETRTC